MAIQVSQIIEYSINLADFIALWQPISTALAAFGWTQTSDTGQVNWGTISTEPSIGTYVYQIWVMADSLQSSAPVYLKLYFGTSATSLGYPALEIQIGNGSNGLGTLTNSSSTISCIATSYLSTSVPLYLSGDTNRVAMGTLGTNPAFFFSIERIKNSSGADTSNGVTMVFWGGGTTVCQTTIIGLGSTPLIYSYTTRWLSFGTSAATTISNHAVSMYPVIPVDANYVYYPPMMNVLVGRTGDLAMGLVIPVTVYENSIPFRIFGPAEVSHYTSSEYIAMRWN